MSPVEWYYARGNKQMGPVASTELKRLASEGQLRPEDLVLREGMAEWTLRRNVRGLFEEDRAVAAITDALPSGAAGGPSSASQAMAATSVTTAKAVAARTPRRHLFDMLLDGLRARFTADFIEKTAKAFRAAGSYGLFLAMVLVAAFTVITAVRSRRLDDIPPGVAVILVLAVLQYAASKFCDVLEQLNRTTSSSLSSTAFPDFCASQSLAVGLASLIGSPLTTVAGAMHAAMGADVTVVAGVVGFLFGMVGICRLRLPGRVGRESGGAERFDRARTLRRRRSDRRVGVRC